MTKDGKTAKRIFIVVTLVLVIAAMTLSTIDYVNSSTSLLLELASEIVFLLIFVALLTKSGKMMICISSVSILVMLIFLILFLMDHPTRHWP